MKESQALYNQTRNDGVTHYVIIEQGKVARLVVEEGTVVDGVRKPIKDLNVQEVSLSLSWLLASTPQEADEIRNRGKNPYVYTP